MRPTDRHRRVENGYQLIGLAYVLEPTGSQCLESEDLKTAGSIVALSGLSAEGAEYTTRQRGPRCESIDGGDVS